MKKILFVLLLFSMAFMHTIDAAAQVKLQPSSDSVVNAQTKILTVSRVPDFTVMNVDLQLTKASTGGGTVAGNAKLEGSNGLDWYTITDDHSIGQVTLTDGNNKIHWSVSSREYINYRVSVTGTGTMKAYIAAVGYFPKPDSR